MRAEEWQRIRPILESALELDRIERSLYLDRECRDPFLRREVESLIAAHEGVATGVLDHAAGPAFIAENEPRFRLLAGKRIGPYEILEEIAIGGMGTVYRAIRADGQYKQQVALKIVRVELGAELTETRFRNERQILASLNHPNIARILDGGTTSDGIPYFVMEFIDGLPVTEYCERHNLTIDGRLRIFRTVCSAVHYAHQHLVIHRDLKPTNILVTAEGTPKLLDFGIAKILDPGLLPEGLSVTGAGFWMMTPEYASPEQLRGEAINTASDVYSLGLILYELLAGRRAYTFPSSMPHEVARVVLETDPEKPSTAVRTETIEPAKSENVAPGQELASSLHGDSLEKRSQRLAGDLDNIVLKAIRKEPAARYASVDQLSEDIGRHLEGLPVLARKSTVAYRCRKYVLRHKVGVAAAVVVLLSLLAGLTLTLREARIARANELRAQRRFNDVRKLSNSLIFEIHDSIQNLPGATPARKVLLDRAREYLDTLAADSNGDLTLQRDLAAAYLRVGSLQGISVDSNTGETEAGISSLQKAVSLADAVAKANPGNLDDQLNAARAHSQLSSVLGNSGRPGAREEIEEAIAITDRILATGSANAKLLIQQALEYDRLAFFQDDAGDVQAAVETLKKGLATGEALLKSGTQDKKQMNRVAIGRVRLGNELVMLGSRKEALEYNSAGLNLYETLTQDKTNAKARREMAVTLSFRGNILMMDGNAQDALASYRRSLGMVQELERVDPENTLYHLDVAGDTAAMGRARASLGRSAEGLAMMEKAIGVLQENYARNHSYTDIPYWLGQDHIWKGEILMKAGDVRGAREQYRLGISSLESLVNGSASISIRCDLAASYTKIAGAFAGTKDYQQASDFYSKALKIAQPLALANPPNVLALYAAADAYFGMGELVIRTPLRSTSIGRGEGRSHLREACEWYRKSAGAWRQIHNPGRITPSGFATGDPEIVATKLRRCDADSAGTEISQK